VPFSQAALALAPALCRSRPPARLSDLPGEPEPCATAPSRGERALEGQSPPGASMAVRRLLPLPSPAALGFAAIPSMVGRIDQRNLLLTTRFTRISHG
jgi:hypothetical protein